MGIEGNIDLQAVHERTRKRREEKLREHGLEELKLDSGEETPIGDIILDFNSSQEDLAHNKEGELKPEIYEEFISQLKPEYKPEFDKLDNFKKAEIVALDKFPEEKIIKIIEYSLTHREKTIHAFHSIKNTLIYLSKWIDEKINPKFMHYVNYIEERQSEITRRENEAEQNDQSITGKAA